MDNNIKADIDDFLAQKSIAIAGYSSKKGQPANSIYDKFKKNNYTVFAVNPKHSKIGGIDCFKSLKDLPQKVEGVVVCTSPSATLEVIQECVDSHIPRVWIHRSFGQGSFHKKAIELCRENNIKCIAGGCPMMFLKADIVHKCMKWILNAQGKFELKQA